MAEGAPLFSPDKSNESSPDDEKLRNKKAELITKVMQKLRRVELGLETEVDENTRNFKTSLRAISFRLGTQAVTQADDDEDA